MRLGRISRLAVGLATMLCSGAVAVMLAGPALGAFPYTRGGGDPTDYKNYFLGPGDDPAADLSGNETWMYSATSEGTPPLDPLGIENGFIRGARITDAADAPLTAWELTTGRPDVVIAVHDSGIKWNDHGAMINLRLKTALNEGELPAPLADRASSLLNGGSCAGYTAGVDDANGDEIFNLADFACDSRVSVTDPRRVGPAGFLTPQDLLLAFSDSDDDDSNGFTDDMVGWDFLDDDNDPYDDVQYGHGTGEANDSVAEADNGQGGIGACPNCVAMHIRVGDSFIADVNRFARGVTYSVDNGALVIQEALGTVNNTRLSRQAVNYAYGHGVTVIASAADEAAQHNNWPSSLPHVILVNSVTQYDSTLSPVPQSYLQFNGCTNFNAKITLAIPSVSCSSDATGRGSGMAGLVYSAALNASEHGALLDHPTCERAVDEDGTAGLDPCVITPNEVRQLMATGTVDGTTQAEDVDFLEPLLEPSCSPVPAPGCTSTTASVAQVAVARPVISPLAETRSYPARGGPDQFYGYGRVHMANAVGALLRPDGGGGFDPSLLPPEVEITSPEWYDQLDPDAASFEITGQISKRPGSGDCDYRVLIAPGHYPHNAETPTGDFEQVATGECDTPVDGTLATVTTDDLEARFPPGTDFGGAQPQPTPLVDNGRPFAAPHGFTVRVTATTSQDGVDLEGDDRRAMWLHRDADMLDSFPRKLTENSSQTGDGESSPALADLDGDNQNELIVGSSDGFVHAFRRDGSELPGWPVRTDSPGFHHPGGRAFTSGEVSSDFGGAMLASVAVGDTDHDGIPEVWGADFEGKVYGWRAGGQRFFEREANEDFSGKPLSPFQNVRQGETNRTQHGFIGSPVLADIDGDVALEIVAASMDRHLYAWNPNGSAVPGYPVLVVDPAKVDGAGGAIDPDTHRVSFEAGAGSEQQGAIVDTPAIGDLDADANDTGPDELPEIVIGTNEEYVAASDGGLNADSVNAGAFPVLETAGVLDPGNTRMYALNATGDSDGNPNPSNAIRPGWPARIGVALTGLLPIVGEGVTGSPIIGPVTCPSGGAGPKVGAQPAAGFAYILNPNAESCYGREGGRDITLQANFGASAGKYDTPVLAAVGSPAFGSLIPGASPSFLTPAAGAIRALDLAVNEYQGGQDFIGAWNSETGLPQPGFPYAVNDLQFLTGPSIADINGLPGEEVVGGSASFDLAAVSAAGAAVPGWPKLSGDWTIATPVIGSLGSTDTDTAARKVVVGLTRSGYVFAYETDAPACSASSWPRFHHDNANSGNYDRDAVLPGKPTNPSLSGSPGTIEIDAPGDDLLCGTAAEWELVTADSPIDESNFGQATPLEGEPEPVAPGTHQTFPIPTGSLRHLALRAVDDQGNVGRIATFDQGADPDTDGDGVPNETDNCDVVPNPSQEDADGDGIGNVCEPDTDGDGVLDDDDNCDNADNPGQEDGDGDGTGDACETPGQGLDIGPCRNTQIGTAGPDTLTGTKAGDRLLGRGGKDRLLGLGGADCLEGNKGNDRLKGGGASDTLRGMTGRDRIAGGLGPDIAIAGRGRDRIFSNDRSRDVVRCGKGRDLVNADPSDRLFGCERVIRKRR